MTTKIVLNTEWLSQNTINFNLIVKNAPQTITINKKTHLVLVRKKNDLESLIDEFVLEERSIEWQAHSPEQHTVFVPTGAIAGLASVAAAVAGGSSSAVTSSSVASVSATSVSAIESPSTVSAATPVIVESPPTFTQPVAMPAVPVTPVPLLSRPSAEVKLFDAPAYWLGDIFVTDLNKDGIDEIVIAGRKSHPSDIASWQSSYVNVVGWNTGSWADETQSWFPNGDNQILGTEPDVEFADFDGDGRVDIWIAPSTDMEMYGPGIVYFNTEQGLMRHEIDMGDIWAHDSVIVDVNSDGFSDIVASSYGPGQVIALGRPDRDFDVYTGSATANYSGITAGDFLGDGSVTFVMVDAWGDGVSDTALYQLIMPLAVTGISGGDLVLDQQSRFVQHSVLPADRFTRAEYADMPWLKLGGQHPHSVRATTMDFNRDGLDDVIVSTSANAQDGTWHTWFELQFLENQGAGIFIDRTDSILVDWDTLTTVSYQPRVRDVNGDGLLDLWFSSQDYNGIENSNRVLFAQPDGTFHQAWQDEFAELRQELGGQPSPVIWLQGPDQSYLASMMWDEISNHADIKLIGDFFA